MLELVYVQQGGKRNFVPLGDQDLMRLTGRSRHQISYDRRALAELVKLGMLRKVQGRGSIANGYALREPRLWDKRVRWLGPRERILSFFWLLQPRDLIDLSRDDAGSSLFFRATGILRAEVSPREDAGHEMAIARRQRAATESRRAENSADDARGSGSHRAENPNGGAGLHTVLLASKEAFELENLDEEERGRLTREAEAIGRRVALRCGFKSTKLWGQALAPIMEAVIRHHDHVEDLYTLAVTVPETCGTEPWRSAVKAAETFADLADQAAEAGWPHPYASQIAGLERRIRTLEDFAPDSSQLPELYAELAGLRAGIAS